MSDKLERLIKVVYKKWKAGHPKMHQPHPDEETLACFSEDRLSQEENERIKAHLISCEACAEIFSTQARLGVAEDKQVPEALLERVKNLVIEKEGPFILEILLRLKEETLEILRTTGDVLVGREFVPAAILRSRKIKDFKDEVTILKDFRDIRVEVRIENKRGRAFNLTVVAKEKKTQEIIKNLRIALLRDDLELESYLTDSGKVTFEHVLLGKYTIEITGLKDKFASILLDIKM